ncbi:MAG: isoprenylcysteine carboxylmethyltransferase family protein [Sphingomonas sp.]|nr:isoprenylcysteine carboxylmethyltransferase family protein [Sphingomonas sp.]
MTDEDGPGVFVPPPLVFGAATAAGVLLDGNALEWRHVTHPSQFAGAVVAVAGLVLIAICLGLFRRFRTRPEPWEPDQTLIRTGVYRFSRNPMYLGMALTSAGIAIFFESLVAAILVAFVVVAIDRLVIPREERYLARRFGADYKAYRDRVRRWL